MIPFEQMKISISNCPPGLYVLAEIAKVVSLVTKRRNVTLTQCGEYGVFVYTTLVNSTFRARWLASSKVISQVLFTSEQPKKNKWFCRYIFANKVTLWATSYSACFLHTKTIIHLSVGESRGYYLALRGSANIHHYSPPLRWIIVK